MLSLRKSRELTREELAVELGCSASAIVHWEGGKRTIPPWVEEKMLSNVRVELPLDDLALLVDYARRHKLDFEHLLSGAIRDYIRKAPGEKKPGNVLPMPPEAATLDRVAETPSEYKP